MADVATMPTRVDGVWLDLATNITFDDWQERLDKREYKHINKESITQKASRDRRSLSRMLNWFGLTIDKFERLTTESVAGYRLSSEPVIYQDPRRQLWHDWQVVVDNYHEN